MSNTSHLPKYLVGQWKHHTALDTPGDDPVVCVAAAELRHSIGEYHCWTPRALDSNDPPHPDDLMFVVMRQARHRTPHPEWQALPHVFKRTTIAEHHRLALTGWAHDAFTAAQFAGGYAFGPLVIAPTHDVVDLALALHAIMPAFEP